MGCFWTDLQRTTCAPTPIAPSSSYSLFGAGFSSLYEDNGITSNNVFTPVVAHTDIVDIATSQSTTYLLDENGTSKGIGDAFSDELNTGNFGTESVYVDVFNNITKIYGGRESLFAITTASNLQVTGFWANSHNEGNWVSVDGGGYWFHAINSISEVYAKGQNLYGQQGDGNNNANQFPFVQVTSGYAKTSAGGQNSHTLALTSAGEVYSTGRNNFGQLGLGHNTDQNTFTLVGAGYADICAGSQHSLLLKTNGDLFSCGRNIFGELGIAIGDTTNRNAPVLVGTGYAKLPKMLTESAFSFAIKTNGDLYATGDNSQGQLGLGNTTQREVFTLVGSGFNMVAGSSSHSIALK